MGSETPIWDHKSKNLTTWAFRAETALELEVEGHKFIIFKYDRIFTSQKPGSNADPRIAEGVARPCFWGSRPGEREY